MPTITSRLPAPRIAALAASIVVLAAALAGCSPADPAARTSTGTGSPPAATGSYAEWELDFTHCLREQGIAIDDPDPETGVDDVPHDDAYLAAAETCAAQLGGPPAAAGSGDDEGKYQAQLALAKCLRDHGVNVADPPRGQAIAIEGEIPETAWAACEPTAVQR